MWGFKTQNGSQTGSYSCHIRYSRKTVSLASTPSPVPGNTGNTEKLKQTSSTSNKSGKCSISDPDSVGFGEINTPSKSGGKIPKARTKPKTKGSSIESHSKLITDAYQKNDDYRQKGLFSFKKKQNTDF